MHSLSSSWYAAFAAWIFLGFAVFFGCATIGMLKQTDGFTNAAPSVMCSVTVVLCAVCLAKVMQVMPMGVAYASYAAIMIVLTTLMGFSFYRQVPSRSTVLGFGLIIVGISVLHTVGRML
jgi:small multidrug resistance pump